MDSGTPLIRPHTSRTVAEVTRHLRVARLVHGLVGRWSPAGACGALADRFHQADRIVVGVPMWNWAYPYKLKQLIDLVTHRGLLFEVDGDSIGPSLDIPLGLALLVRGQAYPEWGGRPPDEFDHQSSYIEFWLRLIGVREVRTLIVEHTWDGLAEPAIEWGRAQARAMAAAF